MSMGLLLFFSTLFLTLIFVSLLIIRRKKCERDDARFRVLAGPPRGESNVSGLSVVNR